MIDVAFLGTDVRPARTAVVIDVLRATSTITVALASGYERVLVAGSIAEAAQLRAPDRVLAGEVRCAPAPGFDMGNSPAEVTSPRAAELVLATTNGAPAIVAAAAVCDEVLVASLLNLDAVLARLAGVEDLLIVAAGTDGQVSLEDVYLAGRISAGLAGARSDAALVAEAVAAAYPRPLDALQASRGAIGLRREGLEADIAYCARVSVLETVGRLTATEGAIAVLSGADATVGSGAPALAGDRLNT